MTENNADLVLKAINIVDVVSSYLPLKKMGSNYKARCPFHEEKTASFNVSESKQIFKCFGCQKAGNAIGFVMEYEKISFFEALQKLATKAGISIQKNQQSAKKNTRRDLIYTVYELANDFFVSNLNKHGTIAKQYLEKRQIPLEIAEKFSLGYALDSFSGLKSYLARNHISSDILPDTGLFRLPDEGDFYDLFRDRLMFPIHSTNGKVVAFGGRALDAEQEKKFKYVNSPTTDIYIKGKELYGLQFTRFDISKKGFVFIAEGYLDFLRLYEKDFTNSVASLGTALTKEQIKLLSRYTNNFIFLYDGDEAGIKAAVRAAALAIQMGCNPKIMLLPNKQDPDTFLLNHAKDDFQILADNSLNIVKFVEKHTRILGGNRHAIQMLIDISPEIEDHILRELFIQDVSETFQISEKNLRSSINIQNFSQNNVTQKQLISYKFEEERKLLKLLLKFPDFIKKVADELEIDYFINEDLKKIYEFIINIENKDFLNNPALLMERLNESQTQNDHKMSDELTMLFFDDDFLDNIDDLIRQVKLRKYEEELKFLNENIANGNDSLEFFEKKFFLKKEIEKLSKNIVRKTLYV
ncbi:MAG: DNA primase [Candidatus Cloacimonetes bacterium]|nr:DNA primase [Candidatus Cloacimonadota bacterium]